MAKNAEVHAVFIDGAVYEKRPDGSLVAIKGESDWARIDAMPAKEIERVAAEDEDSPPMTDKEWEQSLATARKLGLGRFAANPAKARG